MRDTRPVLKVFPSGGVIDSGVRENFGYVEEVFGW